LLIGQARTVIAAWVVDCRWDARDDSMHGGIKLRINFEHEIAEVRQT